MGLPATIDADATFAVVDEQPQTSISIYEPGPSGIGISPTDLERLVHVDEERRAIIRSYIARNLKSGVDYGTIPVPGRESKPSLFKPGAEKICQLLGLTARFHADHETLGMAGNSAGLFAYICLLTDRKGDIVGEGRGASDLGEKRGWTVNSAIKICEKRSQVDAVLRTVGLSEVFTQDAPGEDGAATQQGTQQSSAPRLQAVPNGLVQAAPQHEGEPLSELQKKKIYAVAFNERKIDKDTLHNWTAALYGGRKPDQLTKQEAMTFITNLLDKQYDFDAVIRSLENKRQQAPTERVFVVEDGVESLANVPVQQSQRMPTVQVFVGGEIEQALEVQKVQDVKRRITNKLRGFKFDDEKILNFIAASLRGKKAENRTLADYEYVEDFLTWLDTLTRTDAAAKAMGTWIKQYEDTLLDPLFPEEAPTPL